MLLQRYNSSRIGQARPAVVSVLTNYHEQTAEAQQRAYKEKHAAEQRAKEERIRREAREKAAREREEEMRTKKAKAEEERKAKREGGLWIETHSGKKSKGRKSGGAGPTNPLLSLPVPKTTAGAASRENKAMPGSGVVDRSPKKEKSVDLGGRAGTWGPKRILSRKENGGGVQGGSGALNGGGAANGGLKK